ncbi:MAG: AraC family transcriptional regulator [Gammaproteobacteria bacterium]
MRRTATRDILTFLLGLALPLAAAADSTAPPAESPGVIAGQVPLDSDLEHVKTELLKLKRDLVILEEDLLYPASSQVAVFLSMDMGDLFQLDSVTVKLNGKEVAHHLYTDRQVDALYRGGIQKLFVGNVKQGQNRLTAFFTGRGPSGRDYRRATTVEFDKTFEPAFVELAISDSGARYQPEFQAAVSN